MRGDDGFAVGVVTGVLGATDWRRDDIDAFDWAPYDASSAMGLTDTKASCLLCLAAQILRTAFDPFSRGFCFEFWLLTHTLTHTRKNCVETVGGIPL